MNVQWVHGSTQRVVPVIEHTYCTCIIIECTDGTDIVTDCIVRYIYSIRLYVKVQVEI